VVTSSAYPEIRGRKKGKQMQNESDSHRLDQLTPEAPIKRLRLGYPGTGYSFYLTRCLDATAFTKHVHEADLDRKHKVTDAIDAKCYPLYGSVLPGAIDEAVVDTLCEIHIVVIAQEDLRVERRSWRHEIGHAADFARQAFPSLCARKTHEAGVAYDAAAVAAAQIEVPAYVTEFLCEALDQALTGPVTELASGLPSVYDNIGGAR